jgi:hypothetical protein
MDPVVGQEDPNDTLPAPMLLKVDPGNRVLAVLTAVTPELVYAVMVNLTLLHAMAVRVISPPPGHAGRQWGAVTYLRRDGRMDRRAANGST